MRRLLFVLFIAGIYFPALAHETEGRAKKIDFSEMKNKAWTRRQNESLYFQIK